MNIEKDEHVNNNSLSNLEKVILKEKYSTLPTL